MGNVCRLLAGKGSTWAYAIMSGVLAFVPEEVFKYGFLPCEWEDIAIVIVNRVLLFFIIFTVSNIIYYCYHKYRRSVTLSDRTTTIKVGYGDIFGIKEGKKVINFDECFTTTVGTRPEDIKPTSVCGQYLINYPIDDIQMQSLIRSSGLKPVGKSQYKGKDKYTLGSIIRRDAHLLMAFARLDKNGLGYLTYEDYLKTLNYLWVQIDQFHGTDDVYLPVLGSRITRFDKELTQQELLDIMIASYRLSPKKLHKPNVLHIVCQKREGFSINNVFGLE